MTTVHVGYEVGSGEPVEIPLRNLAVTGQTQESGKTTTLEALVRRSQTVDRSALAFVTKRGESAFSTGHRVQPYFRDRADWQFVTSIIDATLQEKNKFLRPWIMKICRTTRTLAEVQAAVREALKSAKGLNEGVYTQLDAYLELIVPEIRRAKLAATLKLGPGLNVMDVSSAPMPMQMLYVQSALDWINEHATDTVVIVPEAWEFIPEGKGSPVKSSAVTLVRKGSGIGNHIWVDSQDMAGVDKVILRGCPVWLIGVQRESNEIKRNLANIPKSIKRPTAAAVAMLERGQFYVCWGSHAIKTYVQPAWMPANEAREIALGGAQRTPAPPRQVASAIPNAPKESTVTEAEARALAEENERLKKRILALEHQLPERIAERAAAAREMPRREEPADLGDVDGLYAEFKRRLLAEPAVLRVLAIRPEISVEVQRRTITVDGSTTSGRLAQLLARGFCDDTKRFGEVLRELERTGTRLNNKTLATALKQLVIDGFLTKEGDEGYRAVAGMKVNIVER